VVVFCPGNTHPNIPALHYAVLLELSEGLAHHGLRMVVESAHGVAGRDPERAGAIFSRGEADGAIVLTLFEWAERMPSWGVPSVFVGPTSPEATVCRVSVDDELGGGSSGSTCGRSGTAASVLSTCGPAAGARLGPGACARSGPGMG